MATDIAERLISEAPDYCMPLRNEAAQEIAKLRAALAPFSRYYELNDCHERDPEDALEVPIRDLQAAWSALAD